MTAPYLSEPLDRRKSVAVDVGGVIVGGSAPVVVQSMTNTDTADVDQTVAQVAALHRAGSELVRITVDRDESAAAVPRIRERLDRLGIGVPLIGDFHYIGHKLLADHPACAEALAKYRINPGNVGFKEKRDKQFASIVERAIEHGKPVRIGVNWGSLDQELLTRLMDENQNSGSPMTAREVTREAIVQSALLSAELAEDIGLPRNRIILSAKVSQVQDLVAVYTELARRSDHALHLGLTEAGMGTKGVVASSAAMGIVLQQGIGDTIRISLTPEPGGDRSTEVQVAQELLQVMGFRQFVPVVAACPGCGRTTSTVFQELAQTIQSDIRANMPAWRQKYPGVESLSVAVMGCIVNGPGEFEARRYRHFAAGNGRNSGRAGVHRRQEGRDPARTRDCRGIQGDGGRLHREALRPDPLISSPGRLRLSSRRSLSIPADRDETSRRLQFPRRRAVGGEQVDRFVDEFVELFAGRVDAHQLDERPLAADGVLAGRLAQFRAVGGDVEQIVCELKREADGGSESDKSRPVLFAHSCDDCAGLAGETNEGAGLHALQQAHATLVRRINFGRKVEGLSSRHAADTGRPGKGSDQCDLCGGRKSRFRSCDDVERHCLERVACKYRRGLVEGAVHGRATAPQIVVIHGGQVVVDERIAVHAFQCCADAQRSRRLALEKPRAFDHEERPQSLAAAEGPVPDCRNQLVRPGNFPGARTFVEKFGQEFLDCLSNGGEAVRHVEHQIIHVRVDGTAVGLRQRVSFRPPIALNMAAMRAGRRMCR